MSLTAKILILFLVGFSVATNASTTRPLDRVAQLVLEVNPTVRIKRFMYPGRLFEDGVSNAVREFQQAFNAAAPSCSKQTAVGRFLLKDLAGRLGDSLVAETLFQLNSSRELIAAISNSEESDAICPMKRYKIYATNGEGIIIEVRR